ncbi:MAG: hypothetical protein KHX42_04415 [Prevotella sp.]|nr:hypothetical protein [Prevotella sp.]
MKSLALYIDKWYIVGAINTDGITRPVMLPNHEDRIWLYFYEDVANDEISYGQGFQRKYRNNENHYYGDVFSQITSSTTKYIKYKRPQPLNGIFKDARIFEDLRKAVEEDGEICTYVSFSKDISLAARKLFLDKMSKEKFAVKESVARIGHLALEYTAKKAKFEDDGYYLVLNACNENLHYSLYQKSEELFVRENEDVLTGLGTDVRSRAVIEYVVDNINDREHFLQTKEEREAEYLRMSQYVDNWLIKLNAAKSFIPVQLTDVTFSRDPYKNYHVPVRKTKIDERTESIVKDIISVVTRFVKEAGVSHEQIKGILLLGNSFGNSQFKTELCGYYNLSSEMMVSYMDRDLPHVVSAYTFIDCAQFSTVKDLMRGNAEAELRRIKLAEEEAEAQRKAQEEADAAAATQRAATEAERKYKDAVDKGYDAEKNHDFDNMAEYFSIALKWRPDDEEAKRKYDDALRKKAEITVLRDNYKSKIQIAKKAFEEGDWELAKQKAEEALSDMPDSRDAKHIKEEATRRIKSVKDLERYLDRADLFIAKKAYPEAMEELDKAKLLGIDDAGIKERETKIAKEQENTARELSELSEKLQTSIDSKRFEEALQYCSELIEVDFTNSRKWSVKIAEIKSLQEKAKEDEKRWKLLLNQIDGALMRENWENLSTLCNEALAIKEDESVREKLKHSEERLAVQREMHALDNTIAEIKDLILRSDFAEARNMLNSVNQMDLNPAYKAKVRELNKLIFEKEDEAERANRDKQRQKSKDAFDDIPSVDISADRTVITGFTSESKTDDFFAMPSPKRQGKGNKMPNRNNALPQRQSSKTLKDDFFDSPSKKGNHINKETTKTNTTSDDFNF